VSKDVRNKGKGIDEGKTDVKDGRKNTNKYKMGRWMD
jgi:hypothetical protein